MVRSATGFCTIILHLIISNCSLTHGYPRIIPVGFIYPELDNLRRAIAFATEQQNIDQSQQLFKLDVKRVELKDKGSINMWKYNKIACDLLKKGVFAIAASGDLKSRPAYAAVAKEMHVPFVSWCVIPQATCNEFEVFIMPPVDEIVANIIINKQWRKIAFLYDSDYGMVKLHSICKHLTDAGVTVSFEIIPLPEPEANLTMEAFAE
ncbi:unnamed protein product, partial [Soboliphyme baturini]|uniref:ANF_receptor domain-containing protein n=1 Tax=Soboliphyme baturini TaxID=241478 RepID=A0A183IXZ3_9BILA